MNHYNVTRTLTTGAALLLMAACVHAPKKPAPAPAAALVSAPATATVTAPAAATQTPVPAMQPTAPQKYTVKKGDTLWGIASLYLKDAWAWPDIWYSNPSVKNPHLIYPGDVLILGRTSDGRPTLSVEREGTTVTEASPPPVAPAVPMAVTQSAAVSAATVAPVMAAAAPPRSNLPVTRLQPQVHYLPLTAAVTSVPLDGLRPYLSKTRIMTDAEINETGYLLTAFNEAPASGSGEEVYGRNLKASDGGRYEIFRKGDAYVDPESGSTIGYEATYIGDAEVEAWSDPAKLMITNATQEAVNGDRFVPNNGDTVGLNFLPHHPEKTIEGQIMAVLGGVGQIGQYDVLVLNRGSAQGVEPGTVLGIYRKGDTVNDPSSTFFSRSTITLPTERTGTLMVFRVFKDTSYAIVMTATHEIHVADIIGNP